MDEFCFRVMPGHDPVSPLHRCHRPVHHDGTRHDAPVTLDERSTFAGLLVSWHDPQMEWPDPSASG